MDHLSLRLFGAPQVERAGRPLALRLQKELALLMYLAVTQRPHTRLALAALLWPDHDERHALAALRRTIYQLRRDVGADILDVTPRAVGLSATIDMRVDTRAFLQGVHSCSGHPHPAQTPFAACIASLEDAIKLYADDFSAGFSLPDSPMFEEWQFFEREGLRAECLRILGMLTNYYEQRQDYARALEMARRWLSHEPYHESAHRAVIRLHLLLGQRAAAQRHYELCQRLLSEELGLQLLPETEHLSQRIMDGAMDLKIQQTTQYARNGTTYLAYQTFGAGNIDLLIVGGFITHLEQLWEEPDLVRFHQQLGAVARVIMYDKRGVGLSDRVASAPSNAQHIADALAILAATGTRRVVVLAVSDGATIGIPLAVEHAASIAGLIIYGGQAKGVQSADYPWGLTPAQYQRWMEKLVKGWGEPVNLEYFAPSRAQDQRLRQWWAQTQRLAASPGAVQAILAGIRDADVRSRLARIQAPTLILHRRDDRSVPVESGRYLAAHIPHARYVELAGADHWWWTGETHRLHQEIVAFMRQIAEHRN